MTKNLVFSHTRLSKFKACPLAYKFEYLDGIKLAPTLPLLSGRIVHVLAEAAFKVGIQPANRPDYDARIEEVGNLLRRHKGPRPPRELDFSDFPEWNTIDPDIIMDAMTQVRNIDITKYLSDGDFTLAAEVSVAVDDEWRPVAADSSGDWRRVYYNDRTYFYGKLDLVAIKRDDDRTLVRVFDWKSGWSKEGDPDQAKDYAILAEACVPGADVEVVFYHTRFREYTETYRFSADDLEARRRDTLASCELLANSIDKRAFLPLPGGHCTSCEHILQCPVSKLAIPENPDPQYMANMILHLEALADKYREALKPTCLTSGPVGGFGFWPKNSNEWDKEGIVKQAGGVQKAFELGILTVGGTAMNSFAKKNKEYEKFLTTFTKTEFSYKAKQAKAGAK